MSTTAYYNFITGTGTKRRQEPGEAPAAAAAAAPAAAVEVEVETTTRSSTNNHHHPQDASSIESSHQLPSESVNSPINSFVTNNSTSTSSSSLNQFNSLTLNTNFLNGLGTPTTIDECSSIQQRTSSQQPPSSSSSTTSSSSSSSSSFASSNFSTSLNNSTLKSSTNSNQHRRHSSLLRQTSITPTTKHLHSQLIHSHTLHSLEPKPFKPFKSNSLYLEAMKEDLAEWLNGLYPDLTLDTENFFQSLHNGAVVCRHANHVTQMGRNSMHSMNRDSSTSNSSDSGLNDTSNSNLNTASSFAINCNNSSTATESPSSPTSSDSSLLIMNNKKTTNNDSNNNNARQESQHLSLQTTSRFSPTSSHPQNNPINWFNIKILPFKQDAKPGTFFARDNICQFILWCRSINIQDCLLFETEDLVARKNEKSFILCLLEVARIGFKVGMPTPLIIQLEQEIDREIENDAKLLRQLEDEKRNQMKDNYDEDDFGVCEGSEQNIYSNDKQVQEKKDLPSIDSLSNEDDKKDPPENLGPKPQVITNDLRSLHERVVELLSQCQCSTQFPMVKIGNDGKYRVGDKTIIYLRILRSNTIMVRVGGGWAEFSEYLSKIDRCRMGGRNSVMNREAGNTDRMSENGPEGFSITTSYTTNSCQSKHQHHNSSGGNGGSNVTQQQQQQHHHYNQILSETLNNHYPQHQQQTQIHAKIAPNSYTSYIPTSTSKVVSKSRLAESNSHLNKGHQQFRNGQRLISNSASMSWLSHNS